MLNALLRADHGSEMTVDGTFGCFSRINGIVTLTSPIFMISPPALQTTVYKSWKFMSQVNESNATGSAESDRSYVMTSSTYSTMQSGYLWAPWVQIRFQSTDVEVARTWSSIMAGYEANLGVSQSVPQSKLANTSSAMVAAIVLGALLILAIIFGAVIVILQRRLRRNKAQDLSTANNSARIREAGASKHVIVPAEADAQREASEMAQHDPLAEADGYREARELQCSSPLELPAHAASSPDAP